GYQKIVKLCEFARKKHGLQWAWIDTCCIDKRSCAELSEAINSRFEWYLKPTFRLVFLPDVHELSGECAPFAAEEFVASKWFTRGWTLQELIAPYAIDFYDTSFQRTGHYNKSTSVNPQSSEIKALSLHILVQEATGISFEMLWAGEACSQTRWSSSSLQGLLCPAQCAEFIATKDQAVLPT
ncbi:hypothetical protein CERZMDRAFT_44799, partial [Cercospora zeae-maydis SCOH1-5]